MPLYASLFNPLSFSDNAKIHREVKFESSEPGLWRRYFEKCLPVPLKSYWLRGFLFFPVGLTLKTIKALLPALPWNSEIVSIK